MVRNEGTLGGPGAPTETSGALSAPSYILAGVSVMLLKSDLSETYVIDKGSRVTSKSGVFISQPPAPAADLKGL